MNSDNTLSGVRCKKCGYIVWYDVAKAVRMILGRGWYCPCKHIYVDSMGGTDRFRIIGTDYENIKVDGTKVVVL